MILKSKKAICLLSMTAIITTGCADITQTSSISKDGKLTSDIEILAEKTAADEIFKELSGTSFISLGTAVPGLQTIDKDGVKYYLYQQKEDITLADMYNQKVSGEKIIESMVASEGITYDYTETCINMDTSALLSELKEDTESNAANVMLTQQIKTKLSVTFPYKVKDTNGTLSEDGYTVTFDDAKCKSGRQYAYTEKDYTIPGIKAGSISGNNKITFGGDISIKEGSRNIASGSKLPDGSHVLTTKKGDIQKTVYTIIDTKGPYFEEIKNNGYYNYNVNFAVNDKTTSVTSVLLDNKNVTDDYYMLRVSKNGKHTVIAKDRAGNKSKCTFYIDKKVPVIKGVKNGKTYRKSVKVKCSDNRKLKSVTVNGKKKKTSFKLSKKGTYTIIAKDQAGNKTKVRIKIK